jgi:hypothetical protein
MAKRSGRGTRVTLDQAQTVMQPVDVDVLDLDRALTELAEFDPYKSRIAELRFFVLNRRHFIGLHGAQPDHGGIVVCTYDPDFSGQALRIHEAVAGVSELAGRLIRVNRPAKNGC